MARTNDPALPLAQTALIGSAGVIGADANGYCARAEDNLIASVAPGLWARARRDLDAGKGSELGGKFRAAYSSSALAVNAFAPLVDSVLLPGWEPIAGAVRFEQERSAWAPGWKPTLDVIVEDAEAPVRLYVESKCLEFLRESETPFSDAFVKHARDRLSPATAETYERVHTDPHAFDPLDARQLLKHFLAAKRTATATGARVVLLCVNWEPSDAAEYPVFARHADAGRRLAAALPDEHVFVLSLSYRELWNHWGAAQQPMLTRHVEMLRRRYDVALQPPAERADRE